MVAVGAGGDELVQLVDGVPTTERPEQPEGRTEQPEGPELGHGREAAAQVSWCVRDRDGDNWSFMECYCDVGNRTVVWSVNGDGWTAIWGITGAGTVYRVFH